METLQHFMPEGLPVSTLVVGATILLSIVYWYFAKVRAWPDYPLICVRGLSPRRSWMLHGSEVVDEGQKRTTGPFQVMAMTGPRIILPSRYADEIRSLPGLSFPKALNIDFPTQYPGFESHKQFMTDPFLIVDTARRQLTPSLNLVTGNIVDEAIATVDDVFGTSDEWVTTVIRVDLLEVVARVSSRVFLGETLCRNRRWLEIAKTYTVQTITLSRLMRMVPAIARPLAYLLLPHSSRLRKSVRDAREIINPEVEKRKTAIDAARAVGVKLPKVTDAIGWMYNVAKGEDSDLVVGQLSLSMLAIHTTTEVMCRALIDLCKYPGLVQHLRDEIIEVVGSEGWATTAMYKLKLMDSYLKESLRVTPLSMVSMNRYAEKQLTLADGTTIPKDVCISVIRDFNNTDTYPEPEKFDMWRFVKMRERSGQGHRWQLVSTSPEQLNFGYGKHACPGRFFATHQIKIVLCHLIMKFDWRFVPGMPEPAFRDFESSLVVRDDAQIQARRRKPEIDIDAL